MMFKKMFSGGGPYNLTIKPSNSTVEITKKDSILSAALEAGHAFPHDCKVGSCAQCKCKLIEGKIRERIDNALVLSKEELQAGYILACQAHPKSDLVVEVDFLEGELSLPLHESVGTILRCVKQTHDIMELTISVPDAMEFIAGQYADLKIDLVDAPRSFSFFKAPDKKNLNEISFLIKKVPDGSFTSWLFDQDRTGTEIGVKGPYGYFHLREANSTMVCVGGGSGLAPILSILEDALNKDCSREVVFIYGARTQDDLFKLDEIEKLQKNWAAEFKFVPILSEEEENSSWSGARGLVTDYLTTLELDFANTQSYMCGPPPMIDAAEAVLQKKGVSGESMFADRFFDRSNVLE